MLFFYNRDSGGAKPPQARPFFFLPVPGGVGVLRTNPLKKNYEGYRGCSEGRCEVNPTPPVHQVRSTFSIGRYGFSLPMPYFFFMNPTATPPSPDIMLAPAIASHPSMPLSRQVMMMVVTQAIATMVLLGMLYLLFVLIVWAIYASIYGKIKLSNTGF